jgi:hypothetical protein
MHEVAAAWFSEQLAARPAPGAPAAGRARNGGGPIERLGLGFAPATRDGLKRALMRRGSRRHRSCGAAWRSSARDGQIVDRFRQPADDPDLPRHRVGRGVRRPGDGGGPAAEVPELAGNAHLLKGRTLYGLHLTKAAIRKAGYAVLVEGYFDFAQALQAGRGAGGGLVRDGADSAAGAAAAAVHVEGRAELRPRLGRAKCRGSLVGTSGRRGVPSGGGGIARRDDPDTFVRKHGGTGV